MTQHKVESSVEPIVLGDTLNEFQEDKERVYITGETFRYVFNKHYGGFESMIKDGQEQIADLVRLTVWRAPSDNDRKVKYEWGLFEDNRSGENFNCLCNKVYSCKIVDNNIIVNGSLAGISRMPFLYFETTYSFFKDGTVQVTLNSETKEALNTYLPRLGFEFKTPCQNDTFTYYGMGEFENYCDMCHHTKVGLYESDADSQYVNYVMPQEHGNHIKTKWLKMGNGVEFFTEGEFEFNVSSYDSQTLTKGMHTDEIYKNGMTNIRIDYKVSGIGSNSCGPELLEKYKVRDKKINFVFYMK